MLVVGANDPYDESDFDSEDEQDEERERELAVEQVGRVRHILINKSRDKALTAAQDFVTCGLCMFN
eukprot:SAG31_NODE_22021_length_535_cov_1.415138_1_plen_65_part_10